MKRRWWLERRRRGSWSWNGKLRIRRHGVRCAGVVQAVWGVKRDGAWEAGRRGKLNLARRSIVMSKGEIRPGFGGGHLFGAWWGAADIGTWKVWFGRRQQGRRERSRRSSGGERSRLRQCSCTWWRYAAPMRITPPLRRSHGWFIPSTSDMWRCSRFRWG